MVMSKTKVAIIERRARRLMIKDLSNSPIPKNTKLDPIYEHIFEDANFHRLNRELNAKNAFKGTYADGIKPFEDYQKAGGKTWQLT